MSEKHRDPFTTEISQSEMREAGRKLKGGKIFKAFMRLAFGRGIVDSANRDLTTAEAMATIDRANSRAAAEPAPTGNYFDAKPVSPSVLTADSLASYHRQTEAYYAQHPQERPAPPEQTEQSPFAKPNQEPTVQPELRRPAPAQESRDDFELAGHH